MAKRGEITRYLKSVSMELLYEKRESVAKKRRAWQRLEMLFDREIKRREEKREMVFRVDGKGGK